MGLHKSMLEEFGLSTIWVRRGAEAGLVDQQPALSDDGVPREAAGPASLKSDPVERHAHADGSGAGRAATPVPRVATVPAACEAPLARAEETPLSPADVDDFPWLDDAPLAPAEPGGFVDDTTTDIAALDWDTLAARVSNCQRCRLCERRTNAVFGVGDREADWMLIGEAPGENEDKQGEPFVGQAGKLLDSMLRAVTLSREQNVFIANVIKCRPPGNRNPEPDEVARCEPYLQRQVALVKPKLIVALGRFAAQSLLKTDSSIASLRGRVHDYEGVPVIVTYHPAYLLRSLPDKAKAWADLCLAQATYRESLKALGVTTGSA
jgi:DNA polymerase